MNYQLDSVIEHLLSNDNHRRIEAEKMVNEIPITHFEQGLDAFLMSMAHQNQMIASMAALLLKKKYLDPKEMIERIPREKMEMIVTSVNASMTASRPTLFLKRCCEILVRIYSHANIRDQLVHVIESLSTVEHDNMKLALMYFIEIACECAFNDELLLKYSKGLEIIFQKGLADPSNEVKVSAFKTLTVFLSSISDEKMMKNFNSVLKVLLQKAIQLIKFDQESGMSALESLNDLVENHPKFIKPIFENLLMVYSQIMEARQLLVSLRTTAMAGLLILCHQHHTLVRKNSYFKTKMVPAYMNMLAEIGQDDVQEWASQLVDEVISKNDIAMSTQQHLGQIANELGNKFMLPLFIPYIQKSLSSPQVRFQHSGLTALAILIDNCHESFKQQLQNMLALMLPMMQSQHPRIIYDSLVVMGYMASEFAPEIQINFGSMILEFIAKSLGHSLLKVQYKAALCIVNFQQGLMEHTEVKVIEPYLDVLLRELARMFELSLQKSNFILLEATLESIGSIAAMNNFAKYYPTFMPGLVRLVQMISADTPQKINIKNKAIETMGDLITSVKNSPQIFVPECSSLMSHFLAMESQIAKDDSLHKALFSVYESIVEVLGMQFSSYSDAVFGYAFEAATRKIDFQVIDQLDTENNQKTANHKYVKIKLDLKIDGLKNFVLNTDTFEQKLAATRLLSAMSQHMGERFLPYAQRMLPLIQEIIVIKNSREMRGNMIDCCKFMVLDGRNPQQKTQILSKVFSMLTKSLSEAIRAKDHEESSAIAQAFSMTMPFMDQDMLVRLPDMMMAVLNLVQSLSKEVESIYADKQMDDDMNEQMMGQIEQVQDALQFVQEIMNKGRGMPPFDNLKKYFPKEYEFSE